MYRLVKYWWNYK